MIIKQEPGPWIEALPELREQELELEELLDVVRGYVPKGTARVWRESGVKIGHA